MKGLDPNSAKFYSIAFEMCITIMAFMFLGKCADYYLEMEKPLLTALLSFIGVFISIYRVIYSIKSKR
ncbi:AtpZ/AtpI family protein [Ichthyobacterium seriolicida]|nr:AtpZ/AtpI family protein [Ichthyobacterium seriolicida]